MYSPAYISVDINGTFLTASKCEDEFSQCYLDVIHLESSVIWLDPVRMLLPARKSHRH